MRNRKLIIVIVGFFLCGAGALFFYLKQDESEKSLEKKVADIVVTDEKGASKSHDPSSQKIRVGASPFSGIARSRVGMPFNTDPFRPKSKEEQQWLDRNGYPNEKQLEIYAIASDGALQDAARSGDSLAKVFLDGRKMMQGDPSAIDGLWESAVGGSSYALTTMAAYLGGSSNADPVQAYAYSRVAEMRGDYTQAMVRDLVVRENLSAPDRLRAEERARQLFSDLTNQRRVRFGSNIQTVDPRPISD